jgi:hypothetical protein
MTIPWRWPCGHVALMVLSGPRTSNKPDLTWPAESRGGAHSAPCGFSAGFSPIYGEEPRNSVADRHDGKCRLGGHECLCHANRVDPRGSRTRITAFFPSATRVAHHCDWIRYRQVSRSAYEREPLRQVLFRVSVCSPYNLELTWSADGWRSGRTSQSRCTLRQSRRVGCSRACKPMHAHEWVCAHAPFVRACASCLCPRVCWAVRIGTQASGGLSDPVRLVLARDSPPPGQPQTLYARSTHAHMHYLSLSLSLSLAHAWERTSTRHATHPRTHADAHTPTH